MNDADRREQMLGIDAGSRTISEAPLITWWAIKGGANVLWLQLRIASEEARQIVRATGLTVVLSRYHYQSLTADLL